MRGLARIGIVLGMLAAMLTATFNVASAAPTTFYVAAVHSGGAGATATSATGNIAWSSSFKTVTLTNVRMFVKGGECAYLSIAGRQGSTIVTEVRHFPDGPNFYCPSSDRTYSLGTVTLTSVPAGGVDHVNFDIYDVDHSGHGWAVCKRVDSSCYGDQD